MRSGARVAVVTPALDEEEAIGAVLGAIPQWVDQVMVIDNGSTDATAQRARDGGATVVTEPRRGYGSACLAGVRALAPTDVIVFLDADMSDPPQMMDQLVDPIVAGEADLVLAAREPVPGPRPALTRAQRLGNRVACTLIRWRWGVGYRDLGPFRAIGATAFERLDMRDTGYGWTVEMQIAAARRRLRIREVGLPYRARIGRSKISGTVSGTLLASAKILYLIATRAAGMR